MIRFKEITAKDLCDGYSKCATDNLKDKLPSMTEEEQYAVLASDGKLVKRPIVVRGDLVLVGFNEEQL